MKYQVIAPRVGELSQLYRVVKIETGETLYSTEHFENANQVRQELESGKMSENITVTILYLGDTIINTYNDFDKAVEAALEHEGRGLMDTPQLSYEYFTDLVESGEIGDWRIVTEDDLSIILPDYIEEDNN